MTDLDSAEVLGGYGTQDLAHVARLRSGARLAGFKIGLIDAESQAGIGAPGPGYGRLYDDMITCDRAVVTVEGLVNPVSIECEVAIELRTDLDQARLAALLQDEATAMSAIKGARVAAEIVTSRTPGGCTNWDDWRADNGNAMRAVVGSGLHAAEQPSGGWHGRLEVNGSTYPGVSTSVLQMVVWSAHALGKTITPLFPGAIILTGAIAGPLVLRRGDSATVAVDGLGSVDVVADAVLNAT